MKVTETMTFDQYWSADEYAAKKPVLNGSRAMMVGDNIYHRAHSSDPWEQEDSHHSYPDGSPNKSNIDKDTATNKVLLSKNFVYFGKEAPKVPQHILDAIGYENRIGHRKFPEHEASILVDWFNSTTQGQKNMILGDPFDFRNSDARYSAEDNRIIR